MSDNDSDSPFEEISSNADAFKAQLAVEAEHAKANTSKKKKKKKKKNQPVMEEEEEHIEELAPDFLDDLEDEIEVEEKTRVDEQRELVSRALRARQQRMKQKKRLFEENTEQVPINNNIKIRTYKGNSSTATVIQPAVLDILSEMRNRHVRVGATSHYNNKQQKRPSQTFKRVKTK